VAAPFVLRKPNSSRIIGYYTLSAFTIEPSDLPFQLRRRLPRYSHIPTVLIGRLAVDSNFGGQGWGKTLLFSALRRSFEQSREIAAMAVVVDAKDDAARAFYQRYGFERMVDHEYRLFMRMSTINELFSTRGSTST
jgi:GNAT superfamily N-acetyltransferase